MKSNLRKKSEQQKDGKANKNKFNGKCFNFGQTENYASKCEEKKNSSTLKTNKKCKTK